MDSPPCVRVTVFYFAFDGLSMGDAYARISVFVCPPPASEATKMLVAADGRKTPIHPAELPVATSLRLGVSAGQLSNGGIQALVMRESPRIVPLRAPEEI